jgi:tetratricopeptide (TPR) repeat protein
MRDDRTRLDGLGTGDSATDVRSALSWSCRQLSEPARRMFRLLGVHRGPDITAPAAASLAGVAPLEARRALVELARGHLIIEHAPGRFAFHDLLCAYAAELSDQLPEPVRLAAIRRMLDHYLHTATMAALLLEQIDPPGEPIAAAPGVTPEQISSLAGAYAWFEAERPVISAVISRATEHGQNAHAWQLAHAMREFYLRRGHWHDLAMTQRNARSAARRSCEPEAQAASTLALACALTWLNRDDEAHAYLCTALDLYRELGSHLGESRVHLSLARIFVRAHDYREALSHTRRSRSLARGCGAAADEAGALNMAGAIYVELGSDRLAWACCSRALVLHRQDGTRLGEALAWHVLGEVLVTAEQHDLAICLLKLAAGICLQTGDRVYQAGILDTLGDAYRAGGDLASARWAWREAHTTFHDLNYADGTGFVGAKLRVDRDYDAAACTSLRRAARLTRAVTGPASL